MQAVRTATRANPLGSMPERSIRTKSRTAERPFPDLAREEMNETYEATSRGSGRGSSPAPVKKRPGEWRVMATEQAAVRGRQRRRRRRVERRAAGDGEARRRSAAAGTGGGGKEAVTVVMGWRVGAAVGGSIRPFEDLIVGPTLMGLYKLGKQLWAQVE